MDTGTLPDPPSRPLPPLEGQRAIAQEGRRESADACATAAAAREDELFYTMMRDDSNLAMDWLWLATQVTTDDRRRYCLRRALLIDPASKDTQQELAWLSRRTQRRPF